MVYVKRPARNKERNAAIIERYRQLGSLRSTAAEFGLTRQGIHAILLKNGVQLKPIMAPLPDDETLAYLRQRYESDRNILGLASECGLTVTQLYSIFRRTGVPLLPRLSLEDRFWRKVDVKDTDACWEWKGSLTKFGYGQIASVRVPEYPAKRHWASHRLAWFLTHHEVPQLPLQILHKCGIRKCCNPYHLRVGTPAENHDDRRLHKQVGHGEHAVKYFV